MAIETRNPATEELIKTFDPITSDDINCIIDDVHNDFLEWRNTTFFDRKKLMLNVSEILRN